jgi:lysyl-tRNA synthetase class 2
MDKQELIRRQKLERLKGAGVELYPSVSRRTTTCQKVRNQFERLLQSKKTIILAGRLRLIRLHGGAAFAHLEDGSGYFQILFRKNIVGEKEFQLFKDLIEVGDFIEVAGLLFTTKTGEKTLEVKKFRLLAKALLPLPEKWHGLENVEIRYRKRYLDLIANEEVREIFKKRSLIVKTVREFFYKHDFMEVETPILQSIPGGAAAKPFITHHDALDINLYLSIAPELYLKRLIIGGYEKVFEIARCFRNEGIDWSHNPEFTQVEFYQAYASYQDLMKLTEEFFKFLVPKVCGSFKIKYRDQEINFAPPYPRLTFYDALINFAGVDLEKLKTREMLFTKAKNLGLEVQEGWGAGKIIDEIFKELVRPKIINPTFIINHPIELSPLAKRLLDNPNYVERFQLLVAGMEICNGYSELNDPLDQEERFKKQLELRRGGDEEAQMYDYDFIEALKYGMPPTAGEGIGIDRLVMLLVGARNLREVILFPTLRPKK